MTGTMAKTLQPIKALRSDVKKTPQSVPAKRKSTPAAQMKGKKEMTPVQMKVNKVMTPGTATRSQKIIPKQLVTPKSTPKQKSPLTNGKKTPQSIKKVPVPMVEGSDDDDDEDDEDEEDDDFQTGEEDEMNSDMDDDDDDVEGDSDDDDEDDDDESDDEEEQTMKQDEKKNAVKQTPKVATPASKGTPKVATPAGKGTPKVATPARKGTPKVATPAVPVSAKVEAGMERDKIVTNERERRTLFVRNLPSELKESMLRSLSEDIDGVRIKNRLSRGKPIPIYAFLIFKTEEIAKKNHEKLQDASLGDKTLCVDFAGARSEYKSRTTDTEKKAHAPIDPLKLHVTGFGPGTSVSCLKKLFPKCHKVDAPKQNNSRGFAFVHYKSAEEASKAHDTMQGKSLLDFPLSVLYGRVKTQSVKRRRAEEKKQDRKLSKKAKLDLTKKNPMEAKKAKKDAEIKEKMGDDLGDIDFDSDEEDDDSDDEVIE